MITTKPTGPQGGKGISWSGTGVSWTDETLCTACELWCNTHTAEVGWEDGLKTLSSTLGWYAVLKGQKENYPPEQIFPVGYVETEANQRKKKVRWG